MLEEKTETKFNLKLADFRKLFCLNQEAGQLIQFTIKTFQITNGTLDIPRKSLVIIIASGVSKVMMIQQKY
jgi:hypothetical protein